MIAGGHEAPAPFIVGVARSGTTLLRLMLDAHPQMAIPSETHFLPRALALEKEPGHGSPARFVEVLTGASTWREFGLDAADLRRRVEALDPFTVAEGLRAFYRAYAERFGKRRWGDKTPTYAGLIASIARCLPEAHVLHLIRDGRAVAASRRPLHFGPGASVRAQAEDWKGKLLEARRQSRSCPRYLEVRYEALVREPEATLREICRFLELPCDGAMLDYPRRAAQRLAEIGDLRRPDGTVAPREKRIAIHRKAHRPPDPSRIDAWRERLSPAEQATFEEVAGDLLAELGYRPG